MLGVYQRAQRKPVIAIGSHGTLRGKSVLLIGWMRRSCKVLGETYDWQEYLLFNVATKAFTWLVESDGHWQLATPISAASVEVQTRAAPSPTGRPSATSPASPAPSKTCSANSIGRSRRATPRCSTTTFYLPKVSPRKRPPTRSTGPTWSIWNRPSLPPPSARRACCSWRRQRSGRDPALAERGNPAQAQALDARRHRPSSPACSSIFGFKPTTVLVDKAFTHQELKEGAAAAADPNSNNNNSSSSTGSSNATQPKVYSFISRDRLSPSKDQALKIELSSDAYQTWTYAAGAVIAQDTGESVEFALESSYFSGSDGEDESQTVHSVLRSPGSGSGVLRADLQ